MRISINLQLFARRNLPPARCKYFIQTVKARLLPYHVVAVQQTDFQQIFLLGRIFFCTAFGFKGADSKRIFDFLLLDVMAQTATVGNKLSVKIRTRRRCQIRIAISRGRKICFVY